MPVAESMAPLQPDDEHFDPNPVGPAPSTASSRLPEGGESSRPSDPKPAEARGILTQAVGIRAQHLTRVYGSGEVTTVALSEVSLEIAPGEFVCITGPSGCGKSTLLHLLGGLDRPSSGTIHAAGLPLSQLGPGALEDYRLQRVGTVFQFFNLIGSLTAQENVELPMTLAGVPAVQRAERGRWLLSLMGLDHRAHFLPGQLSGGEQQRVAMARALANQPGLILADEPTGNLDSMGGEQIISLLRELHRRGMTVIMVTHDPEVARYADRVIRLRDGRVVADSGGDRQTARAPVPAPPVTRLQPRDALLMGLEESGRRPTRTLRTATGAVLGIALAALILSIRGQSMGRGLAFLAFVALVIAGFGIVNTMLTTVVDRTREIGVLKALGARTQDVALLFVAESTLIGVSTAVLGPVLAVILSRVGGLIAGGNFFNMSPWVIIASVFLALALSLFSGVLPALRASALDPIRALRTE